MKIKITEHKSVGESIRFNNTVRVFVNGDFHYGYFVPEQQMFNLFSDEQKAEYLLPGTVDMDVSEQVAQQIIDMGSTPYKKARVA